MYRDLEFMLHKFLISSIIYKNRFLIYFILIGQVNPLCIYSQQSVLESKIVYSKDVFDQLIEGDSIKYYHHTLKNFSINGMLEAYQSKPYLVSIPDSAIVYSFPNYSLNTRTSNYFNANQKVSRQIIEKYNGQEWKLYSESLREYDAHNNLLMDSTHIYDSLNSIYNIHQYTYLDNKVIQEDIFRFNGDRITTFRLIDSLSNNKHVHLRYFHLKNNDLILYHETYNLYDGEDLISVLNYDYQNQPGSYSKMNYEFQSGQLIRDTLYTSTFKDSVWSAWKSNSYYYNGNNLLDHIDFYYSVASGVPFQKTGTAYYDYNTNKKISKISVSDLTNRIDSVEFIKYYDWLGDDLLEYYELYYNINFKKYQFGNENYRFRYSKFNVKNIHYEKNDLMKIFPNPFYDKFYIEGLNSNEVLSMCIRSLDGRILKNLNLFDLSLGSMNSLDKLLPGNYILEVLTIHGRLDQKLIKI